MSSIGEEALAQTQRLLGYYEGFPVEVQARESSLKIVPAVEDGFSITVYNQGGEAMISAERWHTHYDDPAQIAWCALWLLTPYYRMVQEMKGGVLVATWIERYGVEGWEAFDPVYFLNPEHADSWIPLPGETITRRFFQQAILPPPKPYTEFAPGVVLDDDELPPGSRIGVYVETVERAMGAELF